MGPSQWSWPYVLTWTHLHSQTELYVQIPVQTTTSTRFRLDGSSSLGSFTPYSIEFLGKSENAISCL